MTEFSKRVAIATTRFQGTWTFLGLHVAWWIIWFALRLDVTLLTLWVSLEAIVQTSLVAMGQRLLSEHVREHISDHNGPDD